ncbi:site-specific recombinase [Jeongeupia naejangsanensis]|uniref:Site-specific recombinase n=1 Tax=Jeongeupia naejangsanensis TaxID=613195 RepID=A0ABS2BPB7_9NEIS|nr:site-specific recombinase [Jeongeupia naejangsanensis]MBM3117481.1 site-specific recombinase [Jeongeupia naejangsanensis]
MEAILRTMVSAPTDRAFDLFRELVDTMRPRDHADAVAANNAVQALAYLLEQSGDFRAALRRHMLHLLSTRKQVQLYTDTGILSNETFYTALTRRIGYRVLPPVFNRYSLKDVFGALFHKKTDYVWLEAISREAWLALGRAMHFHDETDLVSINKTRVQVLEAIQVLSCRLSAIGLEPELVRNNPDIERFESPFVRQNVETLAYIEHYRRTMIDEALPDEDVRPILVLLDQCEEWLTKAKKSAAKNGISVGLTYHLVRIYQHIERMRMLLLLIDPVPNPDKAELVIDGLVALVRAENRKYRIRDVFAENTSLLALQVTEHASHTGEHYIAETRSEWLGMFRSAAGAGVIVGFMALLKLLTAKAHIPLLLEAILFGLNYALGFMLIHMLHFTIATKQPAMTAAKIAATIHAGSKRNRQRLDLDELAGLIVKVVRTQFIAIVGNVALAMPVALLIAMTWNWYFGVPPVDAAKADHLLHDLSPIASLAVFHAAIAGCCLFLAGLISGYYDNKAIYNRIPDRIAALPWLNWLVGESRARRLAKYIENNLGALAGNFYFGMMLGMIGTVGFLLGLPIDIRHITFSSAYLSFAAVAYNFQLDWHIVAMSVLGIALIGMTNLAVSFGLALWVALRSRKLTFQATKPLLGELVRRFLKNPAQFFVPPRSPKPVVEAPVPSLPNHQETVREWVRLRRQRAG